MLRTAALALLLACSREEAKPAPKAPALSAQPVVAAAASSSAVPVVMPAKHDRAVAECQKRFADVPDARCAATRVWLAGEHVVVEWAMKGREALGVMGLDVDGKVYFDAATLTSLRGESKLHARPALATLPEKPAVFTGEENAQNVALAKSLREAFDAKKDADFIGAMADEVEWDDMSQPQTSKGKADAQRFIKELSVAFPDYKSTTSSMIAVGDWVIVETSFSGTHKAPFFGAPPTKKTVASKQAQVMQFKDGKLVRGTGYTVKE